MKPSRTALRAFGYIGAIIGYVMAVANDADWNSVAIFAPSMIVLFGVMTLIDKKVMKRG